MSFELQLEGSFQSPDLRPAFMEEALRDLLRIRAVNLKEHETGQKTHGFTSLGVAASIPDFETNTAEVFIWHAPSGILPITRSEIIRFGMDSPRGFNLILSQRPVQSDCETVDTFDFQILGPEEVSKWIGQAVLSGDLIASARGIESHDTIEKNSSTIMETETRVMKPLIDITSWATQRGMEGFSYSPLLLTARLWTVLGELQGPNGEGESGRWMILEDPWSQTLSLLGEEDKMQMAPLLRTVEPPNGNWLSEVRLYEELSKIIEERRRGDSGETSISGSVRSMLLQKWSINIDMASISDCKILIPGWSVHMESEKILHGRNGRLYGS